MARADVRLYHPGFAELLLSERVRAMTRAETERVAAGLRAMEPDYPVTSQVVETDRAHGIVAIAHPAGEAIQARRGSLTKAAAQAGLEVKSRRG